MWCRYLQPLPRPGLGFASSHIYAIVGPLDLKCLTFLLPADAATHALAGAAWTPLAHRAGLRKPSFYRLSADQLSFAEATALDHHVRRTTRGHVRNTPSALVQ